MSYTYEKYLDDMKLYRRKPSLTKEQFSEMQGISDEPIAPPLEIRTKKDSRPIRATFDNYASKQ